MHNKFCIIDDEVFTGSFNPVDRGSSFDALLSIKGINAEYEQEFEELWAGVYGSGAGSGLKEKPIKVYFCPEDDCAAALISELDKASHEIEFAYFSFTSGEVALAMVRAGQRGVRVSGILEGSQLSHYSQADLLVYNKLGLRIENSSALMHHKFAVIDRSIVAVGSYNPTKNAQNNNDENLLIIYSAELAGRFIQEFNSLGS